ncbi:MAG: AAA family ATPase [Alphaproteobacteria bacterium]|nr:AAA family ATPase [Rickettsiales bacterium]
MFIKKIHLQNFRNHINFLLEPAKKMMLVCGPNGVGKTSILESISMLSPGKGLLGAEIAEQNYRDDIFNLNTVNKKTTNNAAPNKLPSQLNTLLYKNIPYKPYTITASLDGVIDIEIEARKRGAGFGKKITICNKNTKSQKDLLQWCDIIWFSAKQQYSLDRAQTRRALIDRLAFHCNHNHAEKIKQHELLVKDRMAILKQNTFDPKFLDAIEFQIAIIALDIAKNRVSLINQLHELSHEKDGEFNVIKDKMVLHIDGETEKMITKGSTDDEVINFVKTEFLNRRKKDGIVEQTTFGVHKSKIQITNGNNISFFTLSSGQQKLLFFSMIQIFCKLMNDTKKRKPIVLIDEVISFLDDHNIEIAIDSLQSMSAQIWMTSPKVLNNIPSNAQVLQLT